MPARFILFAWGTLALIYGVLNALIWRDPVLDAFALLIATISLGLGFILFELAVLAHLLVQLTGRDRREG
jgi:hypothetical protein